MVGNGGQIMFRITSKKGFHLTFANGYTVSVQFGPGNYCQHYDRVIGRDEEDCGRDGSVDAECAYWGPDGELIQHKGWDDSVKGHMSSDKVLKLMNYVSKL